MFVKQKERLYNILLNFPQIIYLNVLGNRNMEDTDTFLFNFKGYYFEKANVNVGLVEDLDDFEIRDDDVFIITYPKSGKSCIPTANIINTMILL